MRVARDAAAIASTTRPAGAAVGRGPRLSVVVVSFNAPALLRQTLASVASETDGADAVLFVVAAAERAAAVGACTRDFPAATLIEAPAAATVPQMRALAFARCRGAVVALLEDDCVVEPGWFEAVLAAHRSPDVAIGGAVEPGPYRRGLDWAVYFCEYGRFMRPLRPQPAIALALAGNHVTYKRATLGPALPTSGEGFYDMFVHTAWAEAHMPMRAEENLVLRNINSWTLRHVTTVPYHHGRVYAAQRFGGMPAWRRRGVGCLALALPVLKTGRVARDTLSRKRMVGRLVQALPWIVIFMTSWSIGEAIGCVRGAGRSAAEWR